jgi:peroxiredoxin
MRRYALDVTRGIFILVLAACASPPPPPAPPPRPAPPPPAAAPTGDAWIGVMFDGHRGTTRVQTVVAGAPAERGGVQPGDTITSVDGAPVAQAIDVVTRVRAARPGTTMHVIVTRSSRTLALALTLEARPDLATLQQRLVGKPAPDFALPALSGTSTTLAELRGHVVIIDFWATWCGPCAQAMPHLVDLGHKYKDLRVVGISDEAEADIKEFVTAHGIDYAIARDPDDVVAGHYLVGALPTMAVVDKDGTVRALHIGAGDYDAIEDEVQQLSR